MRKIEPGLWWEFAEALETTPRARGRPKEIYNAKHVLSRQNKETLPEFSGMV
jgi:hypothetical protein